MTASVVLHVNHLWGAGHWTRIARIAEACVGRGLAAAILAGAAPVGPALDPRVRVVRLPSLRAADETYATLVDEAGRPPSPELWAERARLIAETLQATRPAVLLVGAWPFGRRKLSAEIEAMIARARGRGARVAVSVRDIPTPPADPRRLAEAAERLARVDLVLVHGDPTVIRLDEVWPGKTPAPLVHTGYVAPQPAPPDGGPRAGVLVMAGGGGHGPALFEAALAARARLPELAAEPWTVVAGPYAASAPREADGVRVLATRDDVPAALGRSRLVISRGGYNSALEAIVARCPLVIAPHATPKEPEQAIRARRLAGLGLCAVADPLSPAALAQAVRAALAAPAPDPSRLDLDGAAASARRLAALAADG